RLLEATGSNRIRFLPNPDFSTPPDFSAVPNPEPTFSFRAWDLTSGLDVYGNVGGVGDASVNGGTSAYSATSATTKITVNFVNEAPQFVKGADQTILEDAGAQTVAGWATGISVGADIPPDANEATQTLSFVIQSIAYTSPVYNTNATFFT